MVIQRILTGLAVLSLYCTQVSACDATWTGAMSGSWAVAVPGNWTGCVPGAVTTDIARFINGASNPTIALNINPTQLQLLQINSTSPSYTFNGPDTFLFSEPATQIQVSSGTHNITTTVNLTGTTLDVTVDSTLNFNDWGIIDMGGSTVNFNGSGTTSFVPVTQGVSLFAVTAINVSSGTLNLINNLDMTGLCGAGCVEVTAITGDMLVTGGEVVTKNTGHLTVTDSDPVGVEVIAVGTLTLNGGNWTNSNTGIIGDLSSTTNNGTRVTATDLVIQDGTFSTLNTGSVLNNVGCQIFANNSFSLQNGIFSLTNTGPTDAVTMSGAGGVLAAVITGDGTMTGGSLLVNNSGTLNMSSGAVLAFFNNFTMSDGLIRIDNTGTPSDISLHQVGSGISVALVTSFNGGQVENNDIFISPVINNNGAVVSGTGVFGPQDVMTPLLFTNSATVIPGSALRSGTPGTMTIEGNFTQTSSGNLVVNLKNPSTFSQLHVGNLLGGSGTATLAGTLTIGASDGYSLSNGDTFTVLLADTAPLNGSFDTIVNQLPPGFTPRVIYNRDPSVQIILASNMTSTVTSYPGGFAGTIVSFVNQLNQMDHLDRLACSVEEKCCIKMERGRFVTKPYEVVTAKDCEPHPWNVYFGPLGTVDGEFHTKKDQIGFNYWGAGGLAGFDYVWSQGGIGMLVAYEHFKGHVHRGWGKFDINEIHASLYGKFTPSGASDLAFRGIIGGSYEFYDIDRKISFSSHGINKTAQGSPQGSEFDSLFGLEYTIRVGEHGRLLPQAQLQYIYASVNGYKEHHAGIYDLKFHPQHLKSLRTGLGLKGGYTCTWEDFTFTPEANLMWQHEFLAKDRHLTVNSAAFAETSSSLVMPGIGRNVLLAGIDLIATWNQKYSLEGRYNFEWNSLFHDHFLYLGFGVRF